MRSKLAGSGEINPSFFKVYQGAPEPEPSAKLARHFANLYEAPILFYVCCVSALAIDVSGIVLVVLAWAYVAARVVHTYIHTGTNSIWPRAYAYFASWFILMSMWGTLVYGVIRVG